MFLVKKDKIEHIMLYITHFLQEETTNPGFASQPEPGPGNATFRKIGGAFKHGFMGIVAINGKSPITYELTNRLTAESLELIKKIFNL